MTLEFASAVGAVYDRAFLVRHYKFWVLREIVRGHRPRLQQTQIQSEPPTLFHAFSGGSGISVRITNMERRAVVRVAGVVTLVSLLATLSSTTKATATQQTVTGPSFPCERATTSTEKLICSDRDLSALDLEYSRLYRQRLQESDGAEVAEIRSNAQFSLPWRDRC